ncbi:MAG TPA: ParB N-terminal domain-containing protein, partial [Bacteroidota bacterium]
MVEQNKTIPVTRIIRSTTNPRTIFDEAKLKELANSMLQKGQLEAITVRPVDDNFELVDGERRYRAAKIAGLKELKA